MAQKPQVKPIINRDREMSILELARGIREGRFQVRKLRRWPHGVYRLYLGKPEGIPDNYELEAEGNIIIIRLGQGNKKIYKTKRDAWVTIPTKYARDREGPVLIEWLDPKTLVVYLS